MVKNPSSNSGDMGSIPSWGTKIPYALGQLRPGEVKNKYILKKKRKNDELFFVFFLVGWRVVTSMGKDTHQVFLPGEFHGQRSLVGYSPWGCKESDTTEQLTLLLFHIKTMLAVQV